MNVLRESSYIAVPWKNGGGITREILRDPAGTATFDWRLSLATIERAGAFSSFEGYERTLVLARGTGVELTFRGHGQRVLREVGELIVFDGGWETDCALLAGPSSDLNLIVSRSRAESRSSTLRITGTEKIATADWAETLICCIAGSVQTKTEGAAAHLGPFDVARCTASDGFVSCRASSTGAIVFVGSVRPRT